MASYLRVRTNTGEDFTGNFNIYSTTSTAKDLLIDMGGNQMIGRGYVDPSGNLYLYLGALHMSYPRYSTVGTTSPNTLPSGAFTSLRCTDSGYSATPGTNTVYQVSARNTNGEQTINEVFITNVLKVPMGGFLSSTTVQFYGSHVKSFIPNILAIKESSIKKI